MIKIFATGGTIDKVYFDALSEFQIGDSTVDAILKEANVAFEFQVDQLMRKDSLDLTDEDRDAIRTAIANSPHEHILVTHGTDTMAITARHVADVAGKTIVFTGSMQPARLKSTDAIFNVGFAIAAARMQPPGVYIAMNGRVFEAGHVRKDRGAGQFVAD